MSFHSPPHPGVLRTCLHWIRHHISSQTTASEKMVTESLSDNKDSQKVQYPKSLILDSESESIEGKDFCLFLQTKLAFCCTEFGQVDIIQLVNFFRI